MNEVLKLTSHWAGYVSLAVVIIAYGFVILEDKVHLKKSKPILCAACMVWFFIAIAYHGTPSAHLVGEKFKHNLLEYSEILLFLLVAMSYINVLEERRVFSALRSKLLQGGWSLRWLFWLTGGCAFVLSPVADNMTTALIMGAVAVAVGGSNKRFISAACINIVVAANAGGAFSPFGDITTLMVWQAGKVPFGTFFHIFPAALVTWLIPAIIMSWSIPNEKPVVKAEEEKVVMQYGAKRIMVLFACTVALSVIGHNSFHLPPVYGMLFGLSLLKLFGYFLKIRSADNDPFDVFEHVRRIEWDTLLFFGGIILAVGGLGFIGYLELVATHGYQAWGSLSQDSAIITANILVGILSAVVDNIPLMYAVLTMDPAMSQWQWLLVTLTAGIGGSMLSIGSAAGVALMNASQGHYTFFSHLRYTPAIFLGYCVSIGVLYWYIQVFVPHLL